MVAGGPIYFFQNDESPFVRRQRKSLALVESLEEEEASLTKQDSAKSKLEKETVDEAKTRPGTTPGTEAKESRMSHYNHELVSRIEEDARLFLLDGTSLTSTTPSLHKFLPLLKQAILTFDMIDPSPVEKITLHEKFQILKAQSGRFALLLRYCFTYNSVIYHVIVCLIVLRIVAKVNDHQNVKVVIMYFLLEFYFKSLKACKTSGDLFEDLTRTLEFLSKENFPISPDMIPSESREVFLSNFFKLTADTEVEYREWQRGSPPQNARDATTGKLNSQVSELTQSFDGSRSGKSR